jgi:electron transport complex protein RnfC
MDFSSLIKKLTGKHWGVHPADHKRPAADQPVHAVPLPQRLHLMLSQHVGRRAPVVLVGQKVRKGELIAAAQGNISAPLHAPTSGVISAIGEITAPHASGLPAMAITLTVDGDDRWIEPTTARRPLRAGRGRRGRAGGRRRRRGAGRGDLPVVGQAQPGAPLDIDTLIINGRRVRAHLSCDDRLMRDKAAEIVSGIRLMLVATGAGCAKVGIEDNKPEAIAAMGEAAGVSTITIVPVPARYPMGSDRQLIVELTGREVPSDARAADVGVIVHNVGTARAVHEAVCWAGRW